MDQHIPPPAPTNNERGAWVRRSMTLRVALIAVIALLLLIPLSMVESLIHEREWRKESAQQEVSATWGGPQLVTGPMISVPYEAQVRVESADGTRAEMRTVIHYAHFLPESLDIAMDIVPEKRKRGIYEVVVYRADLHLKGHFKPLAANDLGLGDRLRWPDATVSVGVSDLRSIREQVVIRMGDTQLAFEPGAPTSDVVGTAVQSPLVLGEEGMAKELTFEMGLRLNGSSSIRLAPVGRVTTASLVSTWADPSFQGAFLPDSSKIGEDGCSARWTVLHLNRPYPQEFSGSRAHEIQESAFGLDLILPVDEYRKSSRAAKYGLMLIILVFTVFFFVEVMQRMRIHPIQYLLVGLALTIFYTLLIAISEHAGFGVAYAIAAVAVVVLVVAYAASVFRMPRATRLLAVVLVLVYGFVLTIIHQEDYALLMGSIGLFIVLAVVMMLSRRIDWYNTRGEQR